MVGDILATVPLEEPVRILATVPLVVGEPVRILATVPVCRLHFGDRAIGIGLERYLGSRILATVPLVVGKV